MDSRTPELTAAVQRWDQGAWCLAALTLFGRGDADPARRAAAADVLTSLGLLDEADGSLRGLGGATPEQVAGQAASPLLQTAALLGADTAAWAAQSDEALLAQGRASGQAAPQFKQFMLPSLDGLAARLDAPGARMLDVGTGVGALAVAYAQVFPHLSVVGIDVMDRVLALAERTVAASPVADRVAVRKCSVADLDETDAYDLAWIPAPFLPHDALFAGVARVVAAMRPGGWVLLGHGKFGGEPVDDALNRFKTLAYGGTPLDDAGAQGLLAESGLANVRTFDTPPGAPAVTIGQRGAV